MAWVEEKRRAAEIAIGKVLQGVSQSGLNGVDARRALVAAVRAVFDQANADAAVRACGDGG